VRSKSRRSTSALRAALLTVAFTGLGLFGTSTTASASGCLRIVGTPKNLTDNWGTNVGVFYQGYNSCSRSAYAEIDWSSTWPPSHVNTGYSNWITIANSDVNKASSYNTNPAGSHISWFSGYATINYPAGQQTYDAHFNVAWTDGTRGGRYCEGFIGWNYTNGTQTGNYLDCFAN
jgi:hypothetical protein